MHEETPETHEETPEMREVTNDQKVEAKKDVDMKDAPPSRIARRDEEKDADIGLFMDAFDDLPEKDETKKLEQDFVNSDPEEQVWKPSPPTSSPEEDSSSDKEKEEPVARPSAKISKFIDMVSHLLTSSSFLTTYYSDIKRTSSHWHHVSHSPDRKLNVSWRFTG
jgi:hypothetical protein